MKRILKLHLHQFVSVAYLLHNTVLSVIFVHHEIAVIAPEIVSNHSEGARVVGCQRVEPFEKVSDTVQTFETERAVVFFGFGHN